MNNKRLLYLGLITAFLLVMVGGVAIAADDGPLFTRNLSRTPDTESGAAQISLMHLHVPAQSAAGELVEIEYLAGDCTNQDTGGCEVVNTMTEARPIIATYEDGLEHDTLPEGMPGIMTGTGFGDRDAFASLSLDDGATWKQYNLSNSADKSSFVLKDGQRVLFWEV